MVYQPIKLFYENTKYSKASHIVNSRQPFTINVSAIK
jgi:hypothetical protein